MQSVTGFLEIEGNKICNLFTTKKIGVKKVYKKIMGNTYSLSNTIKI